MADNNLSDMVGNVAELPADVAALLRNVVKTGLVGVVNVGEVGVGGAAETVKTGIGKIDALIAQIEAEYRKVVHAATGS